MTPEHEIILVQTAEQRQECYDVVNFIIHILAFLSLIMQIFIYLENSRLSYGAKVSSRDRDRWASYPISSTISKISKSSEAFFYSMDDEATHFLLRLTPSLIPIGTIRVYKMPGADYYKLGRLAVLKDHRKYKFGRALVLSLHEWVRRHALQHGAPSPVKIICHSQLPVKGFYEKWVVACCQRLLTLIVVLLGSDMNLR